MRGIGAAAVLSRAATRAARYNRPHPPLPAQRQPLLSARPRAGPLVTIMDSYYQHHVFFCLNQREPGAERPSCAQCDAQTMQEYAKSA